MHYIMSVLVRNRLDTISFILSVRSKKTRPFLFVRVNNVVLPTGQKYNNFYFVSLIAKYKQSLKGLG